MTKWGGRLAVFNHIAAVYGLYLLFGGDYERTTIAHIIIDMIVLWRTIGLGVTLGAHRYWSHRSFEASMVVQIVLMLFNTMCFQGPIHWWARDHRSHHKHTNSNADPYNARRGMFFAHVGWIFTQKHEDVAKHPVPMYDLDNDPIVQFQKRYYTLLAPILCYGLPALYAQVVHNDALLGFLILGCVRWVIVSHATWLVNSLAHSGDEGDGTVDHWFVNVFAGGEGYHKWHHMYPTDAFGSPRTLEAFILNGTGFYLVLLERLGLVTNVKSSPLQSQAKAMLDRALPVLSKDKYSIHFMSPNGVKVNPMSTLRTMLWEAPDAVAGFLRVEEKGFLRVDGDRGRFMEELVACDRKRKIQPFFERILLGVDLCLLPRHWGVGR